MSKDKKTFILVNIITIFLVIFLVVLSIIIINKNNKIKDNPLYISIYQYEVEDFNIDINSKRTLYKRIEFNNDTSYEETIYSLDHNYYNHLIINDGKCYVSHANCYNQICLENTLTTSKDSLTSNTIICMPSGLYIILEN